MTGRAVLPGAGDTIAAVATARGRSALAVVRMSGPGARAIGEKVLASFQWDTGRTALATLHAPGGGAVIDRVMAACFSAPRSFTGEDMLELTTHGGDLVPALALDALLTAGARPALPGEFTRRAVANGKMDLLQAEAVADLVEARSPAMHRAALHQMDGGLTRRVAGLRAAILELEALLAYDIDFPEEDQGPLARERIAAAGAALLASIDGLLATAHAGEIVRDGAVVVLAGPPNSGKSSLFNALLGISRAIVTEVPGTTRDALEAVVDLDGWPVRLVDTAGLRDQSADRVEQLGIEVAQRYIGHADMVLVCAETPEGLSAAWREVAGLTAAPALAVRTKSDLVALRDQSQPSKGNDDHDLVSTGDEICVSAVSGDGLGALARAIAARLTGDHPAVEGAEGLLTRERHARAVEEARREVRAFSTAWAQRSLPAPVAAVHLRAAAGALEELTGVIDREEVLDLVFRSFCIGK
jgi:tRNA modification GTPase